MAEKHTHHHHHDYAKANAEHFTAQASTDRRELSLELTKRCAGVILKNYPFDSNQTEVEQQGISSDKLHGIQIDALKGDGSDLNGSLFDLHEDPASLIVAHRHDFSSEQMIDMLKAAGLHKPQFQTYQDVRESLRE